MLTTIATDLTTAKTWPINGYHRSRPPMSTIPTQCVCVCVSCRDLSAAICSLIEPHKHTNSRACTQPYVCKLVSSIASRAGRACIMHTHSVVVCMSSSSVVVSGGFGGVRMCVFRIRWHDDAAMRCDDDGGVCMRSSGTYHGGYTSKTAHFAQMFAHCTFATCCARADCMLRGCEIQMFVDILVQFYIKVVRLFGQMNPIGDVVMNL